MSNNTKTIRLKASFTTVYIQDVEVSCDISDEEVHDLMRNLGENGAYTNEVDQYASFENLGEASGGQHE